MSPYDLPPLTPEDPTFNSFWNPPSALPAAKMPSAVFAFHSYIPPLSLSEAPEQLKRKVTAKPKASKRNPILFTPSALQKTSAQPTLSPPSAPKPAPPKRPLEPIPVPESEKKQAPSIRFLPPLLTHLSTSPSVLKAMDPFSEYFDPQLEPMLIIPSETGSKTLPLTHYLTERETQALSHILLCLDNDRKSWSPVGAIVERTDAEELLSFLLKGYMASQNPTKEDAFSQNYIQLAESLLDRGAISNSLIANLAMAMALAQCDREFDQAFCKLLKPLVGCFPTYLIPLDAIHKQQLIGYPHFCKAFFRQFNSKVSPIKPSTEQLEELLRQFIGYLVFHYENAEQLLDSCLLIYLLNTLSTCEPCEKRTVSALIDMTRLPLESPAYYALLKTIVAWVTKGKMYSTAQGAVALQKFLDQYLQEKQRSLKRLYDILSLAPNQEATLANLVESCEKAKGVKNCIFIKIACHIQLFFQYGKDNHWQALSDSLKELENNSDSLKEGFTVVSFYLSISKDPSHKQALNRFFLSKIKELLTSKKWDAYFILLELLQAFVHASPPLPQFEQEILALLPAKITDLPDVIVPGVFNTFASAAAHYPQEQRNFVIAEMLKRIDFEKIEPRDLADFWNFLTALIEKEPIALFESTFDAFISTAPKLPPNRAATAAIQAFITKLNNIRSPD